MTIEDAEQRHRDEVAAAYRASARLKLYAAWAAAFGVVVVVAVLGAMMIGWISVSDGLTWLGIAMLFALVPAANFYSDATRTTINAAGLERRLDVGEDLYTGTDEYRGKLNRLTIVGLVVALLFTGTVAIYSIANANTRTTDDDDDKNEQVDDDDDKNDGDDKNEQDDDD
jgi:hypothetical protein